MDNEERERAWAIRQGIDALEQERREMSENLALDTGFASYNFAKAINSDIPQSDEEAMSLDDLLVESDYGVETFKGMDAWDIIELLGLVGLQTPEQIALVQSATKIQAHQRQTDSAGDPIKGEDGEWIWDNSEAHFARMKIRFPGINWLDSEPMNRNEWDDYVDKCVTDGTTPLRSVETHAPIHPSVHQLMGVANIMARGYLDPKYAPHHSHTLLQDDVGVGKTLQFLMVIALLDYYRNATAMTPSTCPPIMLPWKKQWSVGRREEGKEEFVDLDEE